MPTAYGFPNCVGCYVANQGVYSDAGSTAAVNGAGVAQWNDVSGAGNHLTQATAGNRPVYNTYAANAPTAGPATLSPYGSPIVIDQPSYGPSVLFDGSTSFLNLPGTLGLPATGCTVVMCTRGGYYGPVSFGTDGVHSLTYGWFGGTPQRMGVYTPAAGLVPFPAVTHLPVLQPIVHGFRCSASAAETRLYVGTSQQSALPANYCNVAVSGGAVGRTLSVTDGSYGNFGFAGEVFELLVFSSPLTDAMMATLLPDVQAANRLRADANGSQVVFVGDDSTAGGPGARALGHCYPWHLCQQYGGSLKPLLIAAPGQTIAQQQAVVAQQVVPLDRSPFAANVAVVCVGGNDLAAGGAAADAAAGIASLCGSLRSAGFTVVVGTITPRSAATTAQQVTLSAAIAATNAAVRSGYTAYADGLADWANDPRLADYTDLTFFADGCHTTDAGDGVKAQLVKAALDPIVSPPAALTPAVATLSFASFYAAGRTFEGNYGNFPRA
jgi:lysophospholipase L1-like esterase